MAGVPRGKWKVHHENARPHISKPTLTFFTRKIIELVLYAAYSLDLRHSYTMHRMLEANVLGQYGANVGANVGGAGCRLHDASNSPILEANIWQ